MLPGDLTPTSSLRTRGGPVLLLVGFLLGQVLAAAPAGAVALKQAWWSQVLAESEDHPLVAGITWLDRETRAGATAQGRQPTDLGAQMGWVVLGVCVLAVAFLFSVVPP